MNIPHSKRVLVVCAGLLALVAVVAVPGRLAEPPSKAGESEVKQGKTEPESAGGVTIHFNPPPAEVPNVTIHSSEGDFMESKDEKAAREEAERKLKGL